MTRPIETDACTVIGVADGAAHAERIVQGLQRAAFPSSAISVLVAATNDARVDDGGETKAPEGAVAGVGSGGLIGGALGWLTGVGALVIPGLGPFVAAGPLIAALSGAALGATVGGVAGGLVGLGFSQHDAERYEAQVRAGRILVSVHVATRRAVEVARRILADHGAREVSVTDDPTHEALTTDGNPFNR